MSHSWSNCFISDRPEYKPVPELGHLVTALDHSYEVSLPRVCTIPTVVATMTEDVSVMFQKGLSEWWNEETEYIFQRIERWAAYARGYNRLRSQRLSKGRMTMQDGQEPRWSILSNKLIIDDSSWSPRFHTFKKSRRKSRPEETKINCCGTFNYQSNSSLDSTCLETYRYDHSIYFKTIGDIKNGKKNLDDTKNEQEERISISSEELVEWDVGSVSDFIAKQLLDDRFANDDVGNDYDSMESPSQSTVASNSLTWFNVDLSNIELNEDPVPTIVEHDSENNSMISTNEEERNNNCIRDEELVRDTNLNNENVQISCTIQDNDDARGTQSEGGLRRFIDIRRSRRMGKIKPPIASDNNVIWPSVLLNYTRNIDPSNSPHHYSKQQK